MTQIETPRLWLRSIALTNLDDLAAIYSEEGSYEISFALTTSF